MYSVTETAQYHFTWSFTVMGMPLQMDANQSTGWLELFDDYCAGRIPF